MMNKLFIFNLVFYLFVTLPLQLFPANENQNRLKGIPNIQTYFLDKYGFYNNTSSIAQDSSGILFIGNSNGIIQYNGHYWNITETKGTPYITKHEDGIYASSFNDAGFIKYNNQKPTIATDKRIPHRIIESLGQTRNLISIAGKLYILSSQKLVEIKDSSVREKKLTSEIYYTHEHNASIYAYDKNIGLLKLDTSSLNFNQIMDKNMLPGEITAMGSYGDSILVGTKDESKLRVLYKNQLYKFSSIADSLFSQTVITDIKVLNDQIIVGTKSNGLFILENDASFVHIYEKHGLFDGKINKLFIDRNDNLWSLHDGGLSRIDMASALRYYNYPEGIQGKINSMREFDNKLFISTSKGVYTLNNYQSPYSNTISKEKVKGLHVNCYNLFVFSETPVVSTEEGIYKIQNDTAFLFYNKFKDHFKDVIRYKKNPDILLIAKDDGVAIVKYINGIFVHQGEIDRIQQPVSNLAEDTNGRVWASLENKGLYIIENPDTNIKNIKSTYYQLNPSISSKKNWKKFYPTSRALYISSSKGLFTFNPENKELKRDSIIPEEYNNNWIFPIIEDKFHKIWFNILSNDKTFSELLVYSPRDKTQQIFQVPFKHTKRYSIHTIQPINDQIVWIGGSNGLVRMNPERLKQKRDSFNLILNKVVANNDSILSYNVTASKSGITKTLPFEMNNIRFEFSSTDYDDNEQIRYRFMLRGFENEWGELRNQNLKEYKNLKAGKYTFILVARDVYTNFNKKIEYSFEIKPPIYQTWYAYIIYGIGITLLLIIMFKLRAYYFAKEKFKLENIINERTEEVIQQKEKADKLIERILPKETVKELKTSRKAGPYHYNMVTVLFGDFKGFTKITENLEGLNAMNLLDRLDRYFLEFDSIVEKYNIEKIKTIGDAYMCAGGIPEANQTNPVEVIVAALEMQQYMKIRKANTSEGDEIWDLRIGIDTGPIIAGVIGRSKVTYDIWGSTVNMASRMEASGEPGKINITGNTFMLIKDFFICKYRGKMPVKNKGSVDMYFVENFKPQFAESLKEIKPNKDFYIQLQLLRFNDLENTVLNKLEEGLTDNLYYHNVKHTIDVVTQVEIIGKSENIDDEELLILKTAALFHDAGHMISYDYHEEEGVKMVNKMLPQYNYSRKQIQRIGELIMATKMPPKPNNLLEMIICDADLDYLGRTDFVPVAYNLYKELKANKKISSFEEWKKLEIDFIKKHSYFTKTAKNLREVKKQEQLEKIIKEMTPVNDENNF